MTTIIHARKKPETDRQRNATAKSSSTRSGPEFFDFPGGLKNTEWFQYMKICSAGNGSRRISAPKKSRQKTVEKKKEELTVIEKKEEKATATQEDDDAAWERLRQSGFMDHVDENDPELIAKQTTMSAMNKFKLHPIKKQHWDIRRSLDGTRPVTRQEVAFHCDNGDILLIRNRRVINAMTIVLNTAHQDKILPIMQMKGQDISHWFNPLTGEPRTKIDMKSGKKVLYTPNGFYYGLGPIRRQLELEQEMTMMTPSNKSSVIVRTEAPPSQLGDYETYITDEYSDKDVSGFAPPKRQSIFDKQRDDQEEEGESFEESDELSGETDKEGGADAEFEGEGDEMEEDSEEMTDSSGTAKSKKSIKSGGSELSNVSPGNKSASSAKALSSSPKEVKSNESSQGNASPDPSMMSARKSEAKKMSNTELSPSHSIKSLHPVKSSKSIINGRSKSKSLAKSDEEDNLNGKSPVKSEPTVKSGSEHEKSGGSDSTSPPSMSPKNSGTIKRKSKVTEGADDEENRSSEGAAEKEEDVEEVLSNASSKHSAFTNAEGSRYDGDMSVIPQMGSEHSLLSEVASVYSKTTVDTTAATSTVYGVQTDVFPGVSWIVHDPNYEETWWLDPKYVCGYIPRTTLSIRIINSLSYDERILVISKEYTINDIMRYYLPYNHNAMGYRWEDMFGNVLHPERTVIDNGLVDMALADDNGFNCYPVIILVFVDGFEDEPIISLNPKELAKQMTVAPICRNY